MTAERLYKQHILIVGGNSGMGLALTERALEAGARVTVVGRNPAKLETTLAQFENHPNLAVVAADITDEQCVAGMFERLDRLNHIVSTAADMQRAYGPLADLEQTALHRVFASKVFGPWLLAKHGAAKLSKGGSITVVSGIAAYRPLPRGSIVAPANAAIEGLVKALALELAPIRVNAVSPGWVDTPIWEDVVGGRKDEALQAMAAKLPVGRIGKADDVAEMLICAMINGFVTGTVLHCDGGHRLV